MCRCYYRGVCSMVACSMSASFQRVPMQTIRRYEPVFFAWFKLYSMLMDMLSALSCDVLQKAACRDMHSRPWSLSLYLYDLCQFCHPLV